MQQKVIFSFRFNGLKNGFLEFLTGVFEDINNIFRSQFLMFCPEEDIYLATLKWIKYDLDSRRSKLFDLISHLKFHVLNKNFLVKIIGKEPLIRDDKQCFNKLVEMYEALLLEGIENVTFTKSYKSYF